MKIRIFHVLFLFIAILFYQAPTFSQDDRGVKTEVLRYVQNGQYQDADFYDGSYALVIGMSNYRHWDVLKGPRVDIEEVKAVLADQGFNVQTELDLNGKELEARIDSFIRRYGYDGKRRLVIYFAGHGTTLMLPDKREMGYIVPVDAPLPEIDKTGFMQVALSMAKIKSYAEDIKTTHALFVFDSCFSGLLTRANGTVVPPSIGEYLSHPVRQFITSGSEKQRVSDDSTFRRYFVTGLRGAADTDRDGYITGSELFKYLYSNVTNDKSAKIYQTPQYGILQDTNLKLGDMVFFLKRNLADISDEQAWLSARSENTLQSYTIFLNTFRGSKYNNEAIDGLIAASNRAVPVQRKREVLETGDILRSSSLVPQPFEFSTLNLDTGGVGAEKIRLTNDSIEDDLGGGVKMRYARVPAGKFKMGNEKAADEKPVHEVRIPEFYMGVFEVTKKQWETVAKMDKQKISLPRAPSQNSLGSDFPVVNVSWDEAVEFCARLHALTGRRYSLPTESEWEYAARAGKDTPFAFGYKLNAELANFNASVPSSYSDKGIFRGQIVEVGSLGVANSYGLFDMHGNVAEWCHDGWTGTYENAPLDGTASIGSAEKKVIRGGSFALIAQRVCSTCRSSADMGSPQIGFRVVMRTPVGRQNPN